MYSSKCECIGNMTNDITDFFSERFNRSDLPDKFEEPAEKMRAVLLSNKYYWE